MFSLFISSSAFYKYFHCYYDLESWTFRVFLTLKYEITVSLDHNNSG